MNAMGKQAFWSGLLALTTGLLFVFPEAGAAAAKQGVALCLNLMIPSLFPFFVLSSLLISTGLAELCAKGLGGVMRPLFGVGGGGAVPLLLGLVGGYPVGARMIAQLTARGDCTPDEAKRLSLFCNNCGPAFLISAVGVGVFGSRQAGFLLFGVNLASAVFLGLGLRILQGPCGKCSAGTAAKSASLPAVLPECVRGAFSSVLGVCAYVILFSVLTALADCSGLLPLCTRGLSALFPLNAASDLLRSLLIGLGEISTGTASLTPAVSSPLALPLAAFLLGWGGLSVHCQSLGFWQEAGVHPGPYLRAKLVQGLLAGGLTVLLSPLLPSAVPAAAPSVCLPPWLLWRREWIALWLLSGLSVLLPSKSGGKRQRTAL